MVWIWFKSSVSTRWQLSVCSLLADWLDSVSPSPNSPQMLVNVEQLFALNLFFFFKGVMETLHEKFGTMVLNIQRWECLSGGPNSNMLISLKIFWVMSVVMKQILGAAGSKGSYDWTWHWTSKNTFLSYCETKNSKSMYHGVSIQYKIKSTVLLTIKQQALASQLLQPGQQQLRYDMVRNQCASVYICLHQQTSLLNTTGKDRTSWFITEFRHLNKTLLFYLFKINKTEN